MAEEEADDTFRILVATDLHIGHAERDPVRHNDTINTFEEVLQIAKEKRVDFLLLGGDLFDENKPSREMVLKVVQLLRKYCLSDRPVQFRFVSDASLNFDHSQFPRVNYEDPNLNVGMPIFSIHGNHDDLSGTGLCALDVLHETGLINLFGKFIDNEKLDIVPILLQKGATRIALYGLGAQKDDKLQRLFRDKKVLFKCPQQDADKWFNIFVLHQTRTDYGRNNKYISDSYIPSFLDLTIWGHEHKCLITPERLNDPGREVAGGELGFVMQPGSTVATSLDRAEAGDKHVALLQVRAREFKSERVKLRSVRQFIFGEEIVLADTELKPLADPDRHEKQVAYRCTCWA